ncbi:MAG: type secretion system protein TrbL [Actinomycetota bacterium]
MTRTRRVAFVTSGLVGAQLVAAAPARADVPGSGIITNPIGSMMGSAAGWAFDKVAEGIAKWVLAAVGFFVNGVLDFLRSSARPDVEAVWFSGKDSPYATVRNIAGVLLVGFVFLGLLQGLLHGDAGGMLRRVAGNLPAAVAGMVLTTAVVARLLDLTDALSNAVLSSSGDQAMHFLSGFGVAVTAATGGFAAVVIGLVAVVAGLLLWVELLVRASLVYLLVAISPLGFAATLWPLARGFLRKTVEILLAVILSKFVISIALAIGVAALSAGSAGAGQNAPAAAGASLGTLLVATVLLGLAAFSPFIVLKLVPIAEGALLAQGISRGPARAAQTGVSTYSSARMLTRLSGSSTGGQGGFRLPPPSSPEVGAAPAGGAPSGPSARASASGSASGGAATGAAGAVGGAALVGAGAAAGKAKEAAHRSTAAATAGANVDAPPSDGGTKQ